MFKLKRVTPLRFFLGMLFFLPMFSLLIALQSGKIENLMVTSESMRPTLEIGDRVFMTRIHHYMPSRGDVIVLNDPERHAELLTKRVIAVAGDVIRVANGLILVNNRLNAERYLTDENVRVDTPDMMMEVPDGNVFVLGDNRNSSYDSLNFGPVHLVDVQGKLSYRYWPPERFGEIQ